MAATAAPLIIPRLGSPIQRSATGAAAPAAGVASPGEKKDYLLVDVDAKTATFGSKSFRAKVKEFKKRLSSVRYVRSLLSKLKKGEKVTIGGVQIGLSEVRSMENALLSELDDFPRHYTAAVKAAQAKKKAASGRGGVKSASYVSQQFINFVNASRLGSGYAALPAIATIPDLATRATVQRGATTQWFVENYGRERLLAEYKATYGVDVDEKSEDPKSRLIFLMQNSIASPTTLTILMALINQVEDRRRHATKRFVVSGALDDLLAQDTRYTIRTSTGVVSIDSVPDDAKADAKTVAKLRESMKTARERLIAHGGKTPLLNGDGITQPAIMVLINYYLVPRTLLPAAYRAQIASIKNESKQETNQNILFAESEKIFLKKLLDAHRATAAPARKAEQSADRKVKAQAKAAAKKASRS